MAVFALPVEREACGIRRPQGSGGRLVLARQRAELQAMPETQCRITGGILEGPKRGESEYLHAVRDSLGRAQAGATNGQ